MTRLRILPCHESRAAMDEVPGGRHCERCRHRVVDLNAIEPPELDRLRAKGRVCGSIDPARARPAAAAILAATLAAGCTPWGEDWEAGDPESCEVVDPRTRREIDVRQEEVASSDETERATIRGVVTDLDDQPLEGAIVVLTSDEVRGGSLETRTNVRGIYRATDLPEGKYVVEVVYRHAHVRKMVKLRPGKTLRLDLRLDTEEYLMGIIVDDS